MIAPTWSACAWPNRDEQRCNREATSTRISPSGWLVPVCELHEDPEDGYDWSVLGQGDQKPYVPQDQVAAQVDNDGRKVAS